MFKLLVELSCKMIGNFDVGYVHNNSVITLRSSEDVREIWTTLNKRDKGHPDYVDHQARAGGNSRRAISL